MPLNPKNTMKIHLLLFATHRETLGEGRIELEVPNGTTVDALYQLLESREPAMTSLRPYTTFAVNREVVPVSTPLSPGDEVALLQPVSGG